MALSGSAGGRGNGENRKNRNLAPAIGTGQAEDIATSPDTQWFAQTGTGGAYTNAGRPARWVAWEERDGVRVRVVYEPASGKIVTAFPDSNPTPATLKPIKK